MKKIIILFIIFVFGIAESSKAQTSDFMMRGKNEFANYNRLVSSGSVGAQAYQSALEAVHLYSKAISTVARESEEYAECRNALRELFPVMSEGAYYFANIGQQDKVLDFSCAHIDISLLPAFADAGFQNYPTYPILANLAATNIYNRGDYRRATDYFKAYLNTTDTSNRELAFEGLARCFYEQKDYGMAAYIASQGSEHYPKNWNMLLIGIESYGNTGNDEKMDPLIIRALDLSPQHKGLLEYQGKMYERQKKFDLAAKVFEQLCRINEMSLDYTLHLGFNLYNAATVAVHKSKAPESSASEAAAYASAARSGFSKAAPVLRKVLDNSPYAANVARALAMCYAMSNDGEQLKKANESLTALRVNEVGKNEIPMIDLSYKPTVEITPVAQDALANNHPSSDVDINIPETSMKNNKTYVAIIGNERYKHKQDVPYANNDAKVFAEYCRKVMGIPEDNIRQCYDGTQSEIRTLINYLENRTKIEPDRLSIIFYYAGHGVPDVSSGSAYIMPADADGTDFEACISLNKLYERFDAMPAKKVTVFLDACFSGATRDNEMLFAERFVEYEVEDVVAKGNTVVFSATSGKQTAMGYDEQQHGFFTYYLLKSLQETKGEICLKELGENIRRNVEAKALDKKNKRQSPQVNPSPALGDSWHSRTVY